MKAPAPLWGRVMVGVILTVMQTGGETVWTPYTFVTQASGGNSPSGVALDSAGNIYVADVNNHTVLKGSAAGVWTVLAGSTGNAGSVDGTGTSARFNGPSAIAADEEGNLYVADYFNDTIRKVTAEGVVTTLAGLAGNPGSADGTGSDARFNHAWGLAVDQTGNVYVTDSYNYTIRKVTPEGVVTTLAGLAGSHGSADGTGSDARFEQARGIAVDNAGNLYVADTGNNKIRKVSGEGVVMTLAGLEHTFGSSDGAGSAARFFQPFGLALNDAGDIFVADTGNGTIRRITASGVVTTLGGVPGTDRSYSDGTGSGARFDSPESVAVDHEGNLYVADYGSGTIRKGKPAIYTPYTFSTLAGSAGFGAADGRGSLARFKGPKGVAIDRANNIYVVDGNNGTIRKVTPAGMVTTFAGMAGIYGTADGSGNGVRFGGCEAVFFGLFTCVGPSGVAVDGAGNLYVTDPYNSRIRKITPSGVVTTLTTLSGSRDGNSGIAADSDGNLYIADTFNEIIRKVTPGGTVTTLAGSMGNLGSADGTGAVARFYGPAGIALDSARNLYVTDAYNNTLRKVSPEGVVTTLAGAAGLPGAADGTRSAARFRSPFGVAVDSAGNAFVTDQGNHTIRKVTPEGAVSTLAGLASVRGSVDGTGNIARFNSPTGVALDSAGNLYVTDQDNNTLRKVTPDGLVTTVAGLAGGGWGSADGTDLAAQFGNPSGVTVDNEGNTYVADTDNNTIRKISPGGQVTTLAGCATCSSGMDDGAGSEARFSSPVAVTVDRAGNVYVADNNNSTIRKVTPDGVVTTLAGSPGQNGDADGTGAGAQFDHPYGLSVDDGGNVYVADTSNNTIRKVTPEGVVTTLAGMAGVSGSKDGTGGAARFSDPTGVAVDRAGNVYVADGDYATVRKITPTGVVTTIAGCAACPRGSFDGIGTDALFMQPWGIAVDNETNVYVGDYRAHTIRRITPDGVVTTVAGLAGRIGPDDGTGMGARFGSSFENEIFFETEFQGPQGLAVDSAGNIYVADNLNNTIRKGHLQPPPPVILLSGPGFSSNGQFGFSLSGTFQQVVIVEVSTNLVNWAGIWTNTLTAGLRFTDDQSGIVPTRFYRVRTE